MYLYTVGESCNPCYCPQMEFYLNVYCPAAMTMGYILSYHGNIMLIKICKECNYKIYKDPLYTTEYMDAYVLLIGMMECCGQGYIQPYPAKSAKLTSYTSSLGFIHM